MQIVGHKMYVTCNLLHPVVLHFIQISWDWKEQVCISEPSRQEDDNTRDLKVGIHLVPYSTPVTTFLFLSYKVRVRGGANATFRRFSLELQATGITQVLSECGTIKNRSFAIGIYIVFLLAGLFTEVIPVSRDLYGISFHNLLCH